MFLKVSSKIGILLLCLCTFIQSSQAQSYADKYLPYNLQQSNLENISFFVELGSNLNINNKINDAFTGSIKTSKPIFPTLGVYYQNQWNRVSFHGGFSFSYKPFGFKYATSYDSVDAGNGPAVTKNFSGYSGYKPGKFVLKPFIDFGYDIGPFKDIYVIETRIGVSLPIYVGRSSDSAYIVSSTLKDSKLGINQTINISETNVYGSGKTLATLNGEFYLGIKWINTTNNILNRSRLGLQFSYPIWNANAGVSTVDYINAVNNLSYSKGSYKMAITSIALRYSYAIF